ncbi:uncharacterized protein LAESUDRAFT_691737 [Laetiporus sulphureus 93-53]|uniref:BTB domain-containing protein n=1 Tax=Laetiporus sulphureus 93-53 TaxID=1314785 RepID=A0A165H2U9_9APHY|nr:uncharacterized protein LAESUDRAFT_691737 [Laetiporus sulphureus 93-53]KZT11168.1 hypothetical protein LAESUDRAFT_691737 [Laetiporus sulphureus 93-53]
MSNAPMSTRSSDFWFDDGNVILEAGNVSFRVHISILCRNSVVFRDLFDIPQGSVSEESDGCPVVRLHDSSADVSALLSTLYDGRKYLHPSHAPLPFSTVASLIRLGHKYQMADVLEGALARLKSCFSNRRSDLHHWTANASPTMTMTNEDAIAALNLARLTQSDTILPLATFGCCLLEEELIVNGVAREDGSRDELSKEDVIRVFKTRQRIHAHDLKSISLYKACSPNCSNESGCARGLSKFREILLDPEDGPLFYCNSFRSFLGRDAPPYLCNDCKEFIDKKDDEREHQSWVELPHITDVNMEVWAL